MAVPEKFVASVVAEVSVRMKNPAYAQVAIGHFVETQPNVSKWVTAHLASEGGEAVMHAVFHSEVIAECVRQFRSAEADTEVESKVVSFPNLDDASIGDPLALLSEEEPALSGYITSNIENDALKRAVALFARALVAAD